MKTERTFIVLIASLFMAAGMLSSCNKDDAATTSDTERPTITIDEPSATDTISVGVDEVHVEFTASDNDKLHTLTVRVSNPADSTIYTLSPAVTGMATYAFHQHITPTTAALLQLTLTVTATDATNNSRTTIVLFHIKP